MSFSSITKKNLDIMLSRIGVQSFNEIIQNIPNKFKIKDTLNIGKELSEFEITSRINEYINLSNNNNKAINFIGNGIYEHIIPSVVDNISSRSEFYTAYTPYQPEVSQGTLQTLYEFQTMICELSGMDVSNASMYDGPSSLVEACIMAVSFTKKKTILLSSTIFDHYLEIIKTLENSSDIIFKKILMKDGVTNNKNIQKYNDIAAIVIQSPNKYGILENWKDVSNVASIKNGLLIAISDPVLLSTIESPGENGADIFVGEGQSLGNPLNYGGPCLGLISAKNKLIRKMPGRIIGKTTDKIGREGFVLTLQTREQHIRRDRATSNICTNQTLMAIRATIYMALLGRSGLKEVIRIRNNKCNYLIKNINNIKGFSTPFEKNILTEFLVKTPIPVNKVINLAYKEGVFLKSIRYKNRNYLLIYVSEKRTKKELDKLLKIFININD